MASTKMSGADATWLHLDRPRNLMVVNTVLWFGGEVDLAAIERSFFERVVACFEVFRSRPADPPVTFGLVMPRWEAVEVDPRDHVIRMRLPDPGSDRQLHTYVGREAAQALDHRVPLWQLHLIEGHGDGAAVLLRTHQALADGPALMHVLGHWADDPARPSPGPNGSNRSRRRRSDWVNRFGVEGVSIGSVTRDAGALTRLVAGMRSKAAVLGEAPKGVKAVTWTQPASLGPVDRAGADARATVPDVALAVIAAALRRCLDGRATAPQIEAIVPVTIRPRVDPLDADLGNRSGFVFLPLPVDAEDAQIRILQVIASMDEIQARREARTAFDAFTALGSAPRKAVQAWVDAFARRGSVVITTIPGPRRAVSVASHPVDGMMVWMPSPAPVGLGISICSYAGDIRFGVIADAAVMSDPTRLATALEEELRAVSMAVPEPVR
jgi:WS/DGAT/MGAT family acyltransferase